MKALFSYDIIFFNNSSFGYINAGQLGCHKSLSLSVRTKKVPKNPKLRAVIQNNDVRMICLRKCDESEQSDVLTNSKINKISGTTKRRRYMDRNQYVFVQFSGFFREGAPLNKSQVLYVAEKLRQLGAKNNVLTVPTFLHKFNNSPPYKAINRP